MQKTRSESLFERFLQTNGISFVPVPVEQRRTPDYCVYFDTQEIVFEVKEIVGERAWGSEVVHSGVVGDAIRAKINDSRGQIRSAAQQGKPAVLLIFNNYDPQQLFGTENHDFEHAMLGADTLLIDKKSGKIIDRFHGQGKALQVEKNTSFSALGRLLDGREEVKVTLFENIHAK
ncbi:unnamed protein product, partial [Phaeothamnion confervicola]